MTHAPTAEFRAEYFYQVPSFPGLIELKFERAALRHYLASAEVHNAFPYGLLRQIDAVVFPRSIVSRLACPCRCGRRFQRKSHKRLIENTRARVRLSLCALAG